MMGSGDHRCEWRGRAETLEAELAQLRTEHAQTIEQLSAVQSTIEKLQRHVFGKRSEKMPSVAEATKDPARREAERIEARQARRENAEKKRQLVTRCIEHKVPDEKKVCPKCGGHDSLPLYRQAKAYRRAGVQVDDSTLGDLFHRTAEI